VNGTEGLSNLETNFWSLDTGENGEVRGGGMMLEVKQCSGRFLGIFGENPSVFKSNQLHVVILWLFFKDLRYIP
jgi:hypothetical protein